MQNDLNVLTISGVVSVNHNISGSIGVGSTNEYENSILNGVWSKSTYKNSSITKLSPALPDTVEFPNVTEIGDSACRDKFGGKYWNLPECVTIGKYAFVENEILLSINLPKCTTVDNYGFYMCRNLTNINLPKCTSVGEYALAGLTKIVSVDLPECVTAGKTAFRNNTNMTSINLPKCETIDNNGLAYCSSLTQIVLPKIKTIGAFGLESCTKLQTVDLGADVVSVGGAAFSSCTKLDTLIIRANTLLPFSNNMLASTKIAGGYGHIYVPTELVDTYKAAAGWSTYANIIEAIPS